MDVEGSVLVQFAITLALGAHCFHHLGNHFLHFVGSRCQAEKPAPHVIVYLAVSVLLLALLAYFFLHHRLS